MCAIEYYTYEDYKKWEGDWELIDGIPLAMAPAHLPTHQFITFQISHQLNSQLEEYLECAVLGEVDYKIDEENVLRPDLVLTCEKLNKPYLSLAPEIVFEIVSPSTARRDEKFKFELYEKEKVKYYVLVYPNDKKAKVYKLNNSKYEKEGDIITKYEFKETKCKVSVDFEKIFKRLSIIT
ncbi:MAG: Uma2 family endonuclease [Nautiliaceae bacterium]